METAGDTGRRSALLAAGLGAVLAAAEPRAAGAAGDAKTVGATLPPFGADDLFLFVPSKTETPSIRAGLPPSSQFGSLGPFHVFLRDH